MLLMLLMLSLLLGKDFFKDENQNLESKLKTLSVIGIGQPFLFVFWFFLQNDLSTDVF